MRPFELDIEIFDELAEQRGSDLISVFIPTHQRGREVAQNPIRLKNQLSDVEGRLEEAGWKPRQRALRLEQARSLLEDKDFWEHQSAALAVYIDDDGRVTAVSIPVTVDSRSYIAQTFHMRHLVPGMGLARVPILVLTKNAVRLLHGTKFAIDEVDVDLPESFDDVNWFVDREKQRQQHPDRAGTTRGRHGHEPSARADADRERFLRSVADAVPSELFAGPLVVLGDDDLVERFAQVSDSATVSPQNSGVGVPEDDTAILEIARPAIAEIEANREAEALELALDRLGVGMATVSIEEALPGALGGRIQDVVIELDAPSMWGRLDASDMTVEIHNEPSPGDADLLDRLVVESRRTGSGVTTVAEPIEGDRFIAVYRY